MKTITITINVPETADVEYITRFALMASSDDWILEAWHIDDVRENTDHELTDDQCREVLRRVKHSHDCNVGINWDVISYHTEDVIDSEIEG